MQLCCFDVLLCRTVPQPKETCCSNIAFMWACEKPFFHYLFSHVVIKLFLADALTCRDAVTV